MYEFKVDLNGDAVEEVTYRLTFDERDAQGKQRYAVRRIRGAEAIDPHAAGTVVAQGTTDEPAITPSGCAHGRVTPVTRSGSSRVLHAVGHAFQDGTVVNLDGWEPSQAKNLFAGQTVYAIVLELPDGELLAGAGNNRRIGVWAVARSPRTPGDGAPSTASAFR